ncbi:MAG: sporulation protein SpoIID [Planctomycetota bacterium]|nr:MAG: sporulation protein SpoIID [Planctomycetota bacterium]
MRRRHRWRSRRGEPRRRAALALAAAGAVALGCGMLSCVLGGDGGRAELWELPRALRGAPLVRVALREGVAALTVAVHGPYAVFDERGGEPVARGAALAPTQLRAEKSGLAFGRYLFRPGFVRVVPERSGTLELEGTRYRGELVVLWRSGQELLAINRVDLESYVAGVIGNEMPLSWPEAALRAQAIAARSYALYQVQARRRAPYDVTDGASSQVYRGLSQETERARAAVHSTLGVVLSWRGRLFPAFFHSTCGGETIPAAWVFGGPDIPPLGGGPCGFCEASRHYQWEVELSKDEVAAALAGRGVVPPLVSVAVRERGPGAHVALVEVTHAGGRLRLSGAALRRALGTSVLRSSRFEVEDAGERLRWRGAGWGHAVGMCQFGARGMAERGYGTREILQRYYPGAELVALYPAPASTLADGARAALLAGRSPH